ncbi:MAG: Crp/Fnr family transcriptional regulator [Ignavibacteria bacterium]
MKHIAEDLKFVPLFSQLNQEQLEMIFSFSNFRKYDKGEIIFFETEPYIGFFCVYEGAVKLYKVSREGREHIVHIMYPYDTFAEVPAFENVERLFQNAAVYPINAMAIDQSTELLLVPAKPFITHIRKFPDLCLNFLSTLSKRLKMLNSHIETLSLFDIKKRLARYIISELETQKKNLNISSNRADPLYYSFIELSISKYDLASLLGTIIETLSRTFRRMQEEKLIEIEGKKIIIRNLPALKSLAELD